jgi:hypothetical protein
LATPRELGAELAVLFADRVEQRRGLIARVARRTSGTQLRAVVITDGDPKAADDELFDDKTTVFESAPPPRSSGERKSIAGGTHIGLKPPATLDELLGEDDASVLDAPPGEQALELPKRHAWRWIALALVGLVALGGWLWLKPRPPAAPPPIAKLEVPRAPSMPSAPAPPALELELDEPPPQERGVLDETALPAAQPRKLVPPVKPRPLAKRAATPTARDGAMAGVQERDLPLETNPYRLQR